MQKFLAFIKKQKPIEMDIEPMEEKVEYDPPFFFPECPKCNSNEYVYESQDPDTKEIFYVCIIHRETFEIAK